MQRFVPILLVVALLLTVSGTLVHLLTESWWFASVNFEDVFWTRIKWQAGIWLITFAVYAAFLWGNYLFAQWQTRDRPYVFLQRYATPETFAQVRQLPRLGAIALTVLLSIFSAISAAAAWETILRHLNPTSFDRVDPIFGQDISFYLFRLPFFQGLQEGILGILLWSVVISMAVYGLKGEIRPERGWKYFLTGHVKAHLCILLSAIALVVTVGFFLERYNLLYSPTGAVFGAGFTDVHARLHAYWAMGFITLAVAGLFIASLWRSGFSLPVIGTGFYLAALLAVNGLYPWFQQQFIVEPNELQKERPYIVHNIEATRQAYGLDQVQSEDFPAENGLNAASLQNNQATLSNIRLWDYRPLLSTYKQLQEIRLYYRFSDVDIDRYTFDNDYRQVTLSAREMAYDQLDQDAQTWVNQRLKFTHGFGLVMSPVNQVTPEGLPQLLIKNIPPQTSGIDLEISQPRIYYGEDNLDYIFTGTSTEEFDYPEGDDNASFFYDGEGGVPMGSFLRRLAYAYDLGSLKILISNYFTGDSRIHYYRRIQSRIRQIAPFLTFDSDPYISVIDGRLQWIIDGYTTSSRYPYSEPINRTPEAGSILGNIPMMQRDTNYIRDAVKITVDAYDGTMRFFAIDDTDPVLATYRKIFPNLFEPMADLPPQVRDHIRYPLDMFKVQAQMHRVYHMENPEVFYNREDLWRFPTQVYEGNTERMEPYYLIMQLPGADQPEFIQIIPFTPARRDNMVAWMAGRSDGENYGRLLL
ncbi:UPF0182 family protein, partial [filamentous cyanobacterium CCP5]